MGQPKKSLNFNVLKQVVVTGQPLGCSVISPFRCESSKKIPAVIFPSRVFALALLAVAFRRLCDAINLDRKSWPPKPYPET